MQVAAALAARHIGGAVNYVGVAGALDIPASAQAAGLAADNLLCVLYFSFIFQLARRLPPDPPASPAAAAAAGRGGEVPQQRPAMQACAPAPALRCMHTHLWSFELLLRPPAVPSTSPRLRLPQVLEGASALAVALAVCFVGSELAAALGVPGATISVVTALTVVLATAVPRLLQGLVPSAEGLACIILQVLTLLCSVCSKVGS